MEEALDSRSAEVQAESLTDDPINNTMLLGCVGCPQFADCGGLHPKAKIFDCLAHCCGNEASCTTVCPTAASRFVQQRFEVGGFRLSNTPRTAALGYVADLDAVELIYHGSKRVGPLDADAIALRLHDLINFREGVCKFATREEMCSAFKIDPSARIIVSGVDHDAHVEPWWRLGRQRRRELIPALKNLGIELITTPNYSVVIDVPRPDNLHAMKRIAANFAEFQEHGLPCALHPNGRTERDFQVWADFIADRPEVEAISYEFITGPGLVARKDFHLKMLVMLAEKAGRPLDLILRGDPHMIPYLRQHFRNVVYIDTTAFMKTIKRQTAARAANDALQWQSEPTPKGMPLDDRFQHNHDEQITWVRSLYYGEETYSAKAA